MRSDDPAQTETILIPNVRAEVDRAEERVLGTLERLGYPQASLFAVRLSLEEALSNAFHHGHRGLPPDEAVTLEYRAGRDEVVVTVEDRGPGFKPAGVPDPTLDENLEQPTGRGLLLMRAYMASVEYNARGNRLTMVYRRPATKSVE